MISVHKGRYAALFCAVVLGACASTDTEVTKKLAKKDRDLPRPNMILVHDFAVSTSELTAGGAAPATLRGAVDDPNSNPQRESLEHQVAAIVAEDLVARLQDLDLPARRWSGPPPAGQGIYTIEGQFVTIDEGSAVARMIIGFGVGGTELKTLIQAYAVEGRGKRLLAEATVDAESSNKPGIAAMLPAGAAVSGIATAAAINTGIGVITEINTDVREGAEDTAEAIVDLMEPRLEKLGWIDD